MIKLSCKWLSDIVELLLFLFICGLFVHINAQNQQIHELTKVKNDKVHELTEKLEKTYFLAETRQKTIDRLAASLDSVIEIEQRQSLALDLLTKQYKKNSAVLKTSFTTNQKKKRTKKWKTKKYSACMKKWESNFAKKLN